MTNNIESGVATVSTLVKSTNKNCPVCLAFM